MTERERLIELLQNTPVDCTGCRGVGTIADYLIENGVTIKTCETCEYLHRKRLLGESLILVGRPFRYCPECGEKIK